MSSPLITPDDTTPWYAVRLFNHSLRDAMSLFDAHQLTYFVPMHYSERTGADNKPKRVLTPVVSNLIFLKKTVSEKDTRQFFTDHFLQATLLTKTREDKTASEISAREMREFIYICDPDKVLYQLVSTEEASMIPGTLVEVTRGPLKGCRGRLVRKQHLHYLLNIFTGFAVMAKVTKWCCKPVPMEEGTSKDPKRN